MIYEYTMHSMELEERFTAPDGWQFDYFKDTQGQKLRYGLCHADHPRGLIILAGGRTQTAEEYFETARDFLAHNFSIAIMDWQGHGGSYRIHSENDRHHTESFDHDIAHFRQFVEITDQVFDQALPKILIAHSMGGNLTLRYLADGHADKFSCAVMVAPMLGITMNCVLKYASPVIMKIVDVLGKRQNHAVTQSAWNQKTYDIVKHILSSDPVRRDIQKYWFQTDPALQCGGITYGWFDEAQKSSRILHKKDVASQIDLPVLFALAGKDKVVDNQAIKDVMNLMPHASAIMFMKSFHMMLAEADDIREPLMDAIGDFINKHLPQLPKP